MFDEDQQAGIIDQVAQVVLAKYVKEGGLGLLQYMFESAHACDGTGVGRLVETFHQSTIFQIFEDFAQVDCFCRFAEADTAIATLCGVQIPGLCQCMHHLAQMFFRNAVGNGNGIDWCQSTESCFL